MNLVLLQLTLKPNMPDPHKPPTINDFIVVIRNADAVLLDQDQTLGMKLLKRSKYVASQNSTPLIQKFHKQYSR